MNDQPNPFTVPNTTVTSINSPVATSQFTNTDQVSLLTSRPLVINLQTVQNDSKAYQISPIEGPPSVRSRSRPISPNVSPANSPMLMPDFAIQKANNLGGEEKSEAQVTQDSTSTTASLRRNSADGYLLNAPINKIKIDTFRPHNHQSSGWATFNEKSPSSTFDENDLKPKTSDPNTVVTFTIKRSPSRNSVSYNNDDNCHLSPNISRTPSPSPTPSPTLSPTLYEYMAGNRSPSQGNSEIQKKIPSTTPLDIKRPPLQISPDAISSSLPSSPKPIPSPSSKSPNHIPSPSSKSPARKLKLTVQVNDDYLSPVVKQNNNNIYIPPPLIKAKSSPESLVSTKSSSPSLLAFSLTNQQHPQHGTQNFSLNPVK